MNLQEALNFDIKEILRETDKAWEVYLPCGIYWIPKSQGRIIANRLYIPEWLARNKEISFDQSNRS